MFPRFINIPLILIALAFSGCTSATTAPASQQQAPIQQTSLPAESTPGQKSIAAPDEIDNLSVGCQDDNCQHSRTINVMVPSQTLGQDIPVRLYLPPCNPCRGVRFPVIYLLHGANADEDQWDDVGIDEAADAGYSQGTLPPVILVLPQRSTDGTVTLPNGDLPFEHFVTAELIPWVEAHTPAIADQAHRAIGGISLGGYWALEIAFHHPELFSAVGGHSPVTGQRTDPLSPMGLATIYSDKLRQLRVWLDVGDDDSLRTGTANLADELSTAGVPVTVEQWQGRHDRPYWQRHTAAYLDFYTALWTG